MTGLPKVGCDIARTSDVEDSIIQFGDRYLQRVFTTREVASCIGVNRAQRLAARFAAKEATLKLLKPDADAAVPWTSIEIVTAASGASSVLLHGPADQLAREQGLDNFEVSMSHDGEYAMAVALAVSFPTDVTNVTVSADGKLGEGER